MKGKTWARGISRSRRIFSHLSARSTTPLPPVSTMNLTWVHHHHHHHWPTSSSPPPSSSSPYQDVSRRPYQDVPQQPPSPAENNCQSRRWELVARTWENTDLGELWEIIGNWCSDADAKSNLERSPLHQQLDAGSSAIDGGRPQRFHKLQLQWSKRSIECRGFERKLYFGGKRHFHARQYPQKCKHTGKRQKQHTLVSPSWARIAPRQPTSPYLKENFVIFSQKFWLCRIRLNSGENQNATCKQWWPIHRGFLNQVQRMGRERGKPFHFCCKCTSQATEDQQNPWVGSKGECGDRQRKISSCPTRRSASSPKLLQTRPSSCAI